MNRTPANRLLKSLRRRRRAVLAALLPWLTAAWLTAFAAPCFAMPAAATATHAGHSHLIAGHVHESANLAGHVHCLHCPPAVTHSSDDPSAHARCAAQDSVGTVGAPVKAPELPKVSPIIVPTLPSPPVPFAADYVRISAIARPPPSVPLNLRHCVFII